MMPATGNGSLRKVLGGALVTIVTSLAIYAVIESISLRDQIKSMQTSWEIPEGAKGAIVVRERVTALEGRLKALEDWRGEGQRFTRADGTQLRQDMEREIDRLEAEVRRSRGMASSLLWPYWVADCNLSSSTIRDDTSSTSP